MNESFQESIEKNIQDCDESTIRNIQHLTNLVNCN